MSDEFVTPPPTLPFDPNTTDVVAKHLRDLSTWAHSEFKRRPSIDSSHNQIFMLGDDGKVYKLYVHGSNDIRATVVPMGGGL